MTWNELQEFFCVFFCNFELKLVYKTYNAKKKENIVIMQQNFCFRRKLLFCFINFHSACFDNEYKHPCTTVNPASFIAHFCRLNPLCPSLQRTTPLFTAFNRFYDKLLINEKLIETLPFSCKDGLGFCSAFYLFHYVAPSPPGPKTSTSVSVRWVRAG